MINDMPKSTDKVEPRRNPYRNARSRKVKNTLANVERPGEPRNPALVDANSNGFPTLPVEIHLEILSHLSCQPIPCTYDKALGDTDRFEAISAISRTCRALHNVYNPLFWRTVEARGWRCREHDGSLPEVYIAQDMRAYSSVLTRAPHLAEFVQVFTVDLTRYRLEIVYRELALCLPCLPNLHTFQITSFPQHTTIFYLDSVCPKRFGDAFSDIAPLPQVHTLTLPPSLIPYVEIKRLFPSLRHMAVHETGYGGQHGFPRGLESIPEYIHTLTLPSESVLLLECNIKYLASLFPHLRVTPYLTPNSQPMKDDDYVREAKKAFCSVTKVWKRVHTIQLEDRPWAIELFGRWRGDQVMEMAKKTLQSNLALKENRDVVEGEIKIWQPSHRLREVISVPRHVEDD